MTGSLIWNHKGKVKTMQKNHDGMDGKNTMPAYRLSDEEYARILEFKRDLHMHPSWSADSPEDGQSGLVDTIEK